jgi:WD40 repeat protein
VKRLALVLGSLALFALCSCSGVPSSSQPEVIRTVPNGVAGTPAPTIIPVLNSDPRTIVSDFLRANLGEDAHHAAARAFLTQDARNKWTDTTVAVVDTLQVSVADPVSHAVTVSANQIGTLDQRGVYTPVLQADGSGTPVSFTFQMQQVNKQWRIGQLPNGLLVDRSDFASSYTPRKVYFLDSAQRQLVPDLRYTTLTGQTLASWLLDQLTNPPRAELQSAVTSDLPEQTTHASVSLSGSALVVDLPGVSAVTGATRYRLAAQLAFTFDFASTVTIEDGTRPVDVPNAGVVFSTDEFGSFLSGGSPESLYYLRNGVIVDQNGTALAGAAGSTDYALTSVALSSSNSATLVAGTTGTGAAQRLMLGSASGGLKAVGLPAGPLSRPAWAPSQGEVWIGDGESLLRVSAQGVVSNVQVAGRTPSTGTIGAVSFSPDGVRIAMVIAQDDGTSQLWIGSVVRSGQTVRVDGLLPITPPGLLLKDVAWNDDTTLYTVGSDSARPGAPAIWSVQVDGSVLTSRTTAGLPDVPDTIAAAPGSIPWVSASGAVWVQRNTSWTPPSPQGTTIGTSPTYLD